MNAIFSIILAILSFIYPSTCFVSNVDYERDLVTIQTFSQITYQFYGTEDWMEGDVCSVIFYNNGTPGNIFDDIILSTRYCGYLD